MGLWTFIAIVSVASMFFGYLNDRNKSKFKQSRTAKDVLDLQDEVAKLKKRVEHLEAIAVAEKTPSGIEFESEPEDLSEQHRKQVAQMARKMRS